MIRKLKVLLSLAAMALAVVSARATDIAVSSGGYDYRLYDINGGSDPHADVTGETAGYTGVVLPTLPAFIKYRGYTFPLRNIPEGKTIGASLGELVVVGDGTDVITNTYERENISLRRVTISGIAKIEGAGSPSGWGYVGAFARCHNLQYIDFLGDALGEIEGNCFTECENLRAVVIPDSVTNIANHVFADCPSVTNIVVGSGLPVIYHGQLPSYYTTNLMEVTINGSGRTVLEGSEDWTLHRDGDGTFAETAVRRVVLRGVASIGNGEAYRGVFYGCTNLTEIVFADNCLTNICRGSFRGCTALKHVTLPESLKRLGSNAFGDCPSLTDIDFGTGTYEIETSAFQNCVTLENVNITAALKPYSSGSIFQGCTNVASLRIGAGVTNITSQFVPTHNAGIYRRPFEAVIDGDGKTEIANQAFKNSTLRCIRLKGVRSIGTQTFYESKQLESVDFVDCPLESIGEGAFMLCGKLGSLDLPNASSTEIYTDAFRDCVALTNFTFGSGACTLNGATHFRNCTSLRNFRYEDGVTMPGVSTYGWWPLAGCTSITNVYVGKGLTTIGQNINPANTTNAFDLTIAGAGEAVIDAAAFRDSKVRRVKLIGVKSIGDEAFNRCGLMESLVFEDCPKLEYIGAAAFASCSLLGSVALPDAESTTIANQAFRLCRGMTTFTFGKGEYQFTGGWHFGSCTSLTSMTLPDGAKDAGEPLNDCTAITNLVIGTGVESVSTNLKPSNNKVLESVTVNGNGEAVIGAAFMRDMSSVKHVVLKGVKRIEDEAFIRCYGLETVEVTGDELESIGRAAFAECGSLTSVTLPESDELVIGENAFYNCRALREFALPASVVSIGRAAFYKCEALPTLTIPNAVTNIGYEAFYWCTNLSEIAFGTGTYTLGGGAFEYCKALRDVSLTATIPSYGGGVFYGCGNVTNLYIGAGVTNVASDIIPEVDLYAWTNLHHVTIAGGGATEIAKSAFAYAPVRTLTLSGVKSVGEDAFRKCDDLISVSVTGDSLKTIGSRAFQDCVNLTDLVLPDGVETIAPYAFESCESLSGTLALPASLTSLGQYAFAYCSLLEGVEIPSGVATIPSYAFAGCEALETLTLGEGVRDIGENAFRECAVLTALAVPSTVTNIGATAFGECSGLETLTFAKPSQLARIGNSAFSGCTSLTGLVLPDSLACVDTEAFSDCSSLASVDFGKGTYSLGSYVFYGCRALTDIALTSTVTSYGSWVFGNVGPVDNLYIGAGVTNLTKHILPTQGYYDLVVEGGGQTVIGASTCIYSVLTNVVISGVTEIGDNAFQSCSGMTSVRFVGDDLVSIGADAFGSSGLTALVVPASVTNIGARAFDQCRQLEGFEVAEGNTAYAAVDGVLYDIGRTTLIQWPGKKSGAFSVPAGVTEIGDYAFRYGLGLTAIELPATLTRIGGQAFCGCSALEAVSVPAGVTEIGDMAFAYCGKLVEISVAEGNARYASVDGVLYDKDKLNLICCPAGKVGSLAMPAGVTNVCIQALYGCCELKSVTFAESVESIGYWAFRECTNLVSVTLPASVGYIGDCAFVLCSSLTNIVFKGEPPNAASRIFWSPYVSASGRATTPATAVGKYPASCAAQWQSVLNSYGKWRGLTMVQAESPTTKPKVTVSYDKTMGKVTGEGTYATGKKVSLKATANAAKKASGKTPAQIATTFAGWYSDAACETPVDSAWLNPSYSFVAGSYDVTLYAKFIAQTDDVAAVSFALPDEMTNGVAIENAAVDTTGCTSLPTVKVTGLPTGLKFTTKLVTSKVTTGSGKDKVTTLVTNALPNTIYGTPTKSGVYTVVATVTTAGKKTASCSQTVVVRKSGENVVRAEVALIDAISEAVPGKVTGMGVYAKGKKVTLKATANKNFVFNGWYDEFSSLVSGLASYGFTMGDSDVALTAAFVTSDADKASIDLTVNGMTFPRSSGETPLPQVIETNVYVGAYVEWPVAASALSATTVKVSGLPTGLKFTAQPVTSKVTTGTGKDKKTVVVTNVPANTIYGTPTAASKQVKVKGEGEQWTLTPSQVKVTVTTAGKNSQSFTINFTVLPLPTTCVGTFAGYAIVDVNTNATAEVSSESDWISMPCPFTATVDAKGGISGSLTALGKKLSFKATGYASFDAAASNLTYEVAIPLKTIDKTWTESLNLALAVTPGEATIGDGDASVAAPNASPHFAVTKIDARRNAAKDTGYAAIAKPYAGTYVATFDTPLPDGVTTGLVTVALTVDAKGGVKAAGTFVDATTFSASATLAIAADGASAEVLIPVTGKSFGSGGMLLAFGFEKGEDGTVAVASLANESGAPVSCAAKYVLATKKVPATYAAYDLRENAAYAYKANAWVGKALTTDDLLRVSYQDGETSVEALYAFTVTKGVITGVGKTTNKSKLTFKLDAKTGLFTGANGKTKVFGALYPAVGEDATVSGRGAAALASGGVAPVAVDVLPAD